MNVSSMSATANPLSRRAPTSFAKGADAEHGITPPFQQAERGHDPHDAQHRRDAQHEPEAPLAQKLSPRRSVSQARAVRQSEPARHQQETHEQPDHADALADAMKREIEMRM